MVHQSDGTFTHKKLSYAQGLCDALCFTTYYVIISIITHIYKVHFSRMPQMHSKQQLYIE